MLSVRNITKDFGNFALKDVSFDLAEGEYFVLLGPSGAGKTLLLETIAGLHPADSGCISLDGKDITRERIQRRRTALVYQDQSLFPHMSVRANIAYPLRSNGLTRTKVERRVRELAANVGVDSLLDSKPGKLSGGEAQRTALARALAANPRALLLDEPICSLDTNSRRGLRSLLRALNRDGQTILHVTHDYEEAVSLGSRVGIMGNGRIVQVGTPTEVFHHPKSEFVAGVTGIANFFKGRLRRGNPGSDLCDFVTSGPIFRVLTDQPDGAGYLLLRSEDVTISREPHETSAQNVFQGTIRDIARGRVGFEIVVDIGLDISGLVSAESTERLSLSCGQATWVSFKGSAAKFLST